MSLLEKMINERLKSNIGSNFFKGALQEDFEYFSEKHNLKVLNYNWFIYRDVPKGLSVEGVFIDPTKPNSRIALSLYLDKKKNELDCSVIIDDEEDVREIDSKVIKLDTETNWNDVKKKVFSEYDRQLKEYLHSDMRESSKDMNRKVLVRTISTKTDGYLDKGIEMTYKKAIEYVEKLQYKDGKRMLVIREID